MSVALGIPQYRLRAIENGLLREIRAGLARRYFHFLGIDEWVARWCRANRELAPLCPVGEGEILCGVTALCVRISQGGAEERRAIGPTGT